MALGTGVRYGAGLQGSNGVGQVVGAGAQREDETARDVLGPDTEAGQALMVAGIGFALVWIAVGPGGGPLGHSMRVLSSLALVAASMAVVNFAARAYSLGHPNGPLAMGVMADL